MENSMQKLGYVKGMISKSGWILLLGLLILSIGRISDAYVLRGEHIIDLGKKEIGNVGTIEVEQSVIHYGANFSGGSIRFKEILRFSPPNSLRADIRANDLHHIFVTQNRRYLVIANEKITSEKEPQLFHYQNMIFSPSSAAFKQTLRDFGIDTSISSVGRMDDRVIYIVGAQYPDKSIPQIWFDKKTFYPLRLLIYDQTSDISRTLFEVNYGRWMKIGENFRYPHKIDMIREGMLIREIVVDHITKTSGFDKSIFDINQLKSLYPKVGRQPDTRSNTPLDEVDQTIENFTRILN